MPTSLPKDEKYTPKRYVNSIKYVLNSIDLDPASCEIANKRIKAQTIFTKEDDGLLKDWFGNVFCNPPYSRGNMLLWTEKIVHEFSNLHFNNGIYLTANSTDTKWFKLLRAYPVCFTDHRISYLIWDSVRRKYFKEPNPENGSCFFLFSNNPITYARFCKEFSKYGPIYRSIYIR